jgi:hypothetical protein
VRRFEDLDAVEVVRAEVPVGGAVLEHVVDGDEEGMGDGDDGALLAAPEREVAVEGAVVAVRTPGGGPGDLDHGRPQPGVAMAGRARASCPADSLLPGQSRAQEARCLAVGKRLMSTPISAMMASALRRSMPVTLRDREVIIIWNGRRSVPGIESALDAACSIAASI